jgi:hypothetical protein
MRGPGFALACRAKGPGGPLLGRCWRHLGRQDAREIEPSRSGKPERGRAGPQTPAAHGTVRPVVLWTARRAVVYDRWNCQSSTASNPVRMSDGGREEADEKVQRNNDQNNTEEKMRGSLTQK